MKGVILSRAPGAAIVDLCHEIAPRDVAAAALALRAAAGYFPLRSLFVAVVDPGVGSSRRILWARTASSRFLAPDNGVLSWLTEEILECRSVENEDLFLPSSAQTFHGRDRFAPVAAALLRGLKPALLGPPVVDLRRIPFPAPRRSRSRLSGTILSFDRFGNAVTNLPSSDVPPGARVVHRGRALGSLLTHYAQAHAGSRLAVAGSSGFIELSIRDGDYETSTRARKGDPVHVRIP